MTLTRVKVNRKAADRIAAGHPWIFSSDIIDHASAQPGDAVHVAAPNNRLLGTAHYSASSQITLRMLSTGAENIDRSFFLARLQQAIAYRERVVRNTNAYRLVHAEGDLLPALIVDRYGEYLTIQTLNQGMDRAKADILSCLDELLHPAGIVARNDAPVRKLESLPLESGTVGGSVPDRVAITMNGLQWQADLLRGQKTGVFLDQRENYAAAARYAHGRALDCFTSTGGFALHLARACNSVEAIDSSAPAIATAEQNRSLNQIENVTFREADVFDVLPTLHGPFDTIVLDPPAFAKSRSNIESAARGYKEINQRALRLLRPGGVLVTCSCSHHFSEAMLLQAVAEAALDAGRTLRVLERRTQAQDHPILLTVPETHYLKCLILEVL